MSIWSTFRFVPAVTPEAMAWSTLSFATFLAAPETPVAFGGRMLDPLAMALAVQMVLSLTKNLTSDKFARAFQHSPVTSALIATVSFATVGTLALIGKSETAAMVYVSYILLNAALLSCWATYFPARLHRLQGTWVDIEKHRTRAVMIEASGLLIAAATLLSVWVHAGPLGFAAIMTFGMLVLRTIVNWIIVLYLLDLKQRGVDGRD